MGPVNEAPNTPVTEHTIGTVNEAPNTPVTEHTMGTVNEAAMATPEEASGTN